MHAVLNFVFSSEDMVDCISNFICYFMVTNIGKRLNQYYLGYYVDATPRIYISSEKDVPYSIEAQE